MKSDYARMMSTAMQCYAAWLTASAEVGGRAMRASAAGSGEVAGAAADALRAPMSHRGAAVDQALERAFDVQRRQLHGLRGLSTLWGMSALNHLDAARRRER